MFMRLIDALILFFLRAVLFISFIIVAILLTWKLLYSEGQKVPATSKKITSIKVTSAVFKEGELIPQKYSCDGENINPPLMIEKIPPSAKSLTLIIDDPDTSIGVWNHWIVWNIPPQTQEIKENSLPKGAVQGTNDGGKLEYGGPCPPAGTHRYYFRVFALDTKLDLPQGASRTYLEEAMKGHVLATGTLIGTFSR